MKTIWIGIDDTDSTMGGCTTYVARTIVQKIMEHYEIIAYPRLVRLNPNVPWKTRGNGALCLQVGKKSEKNKQKIGEINGKSVCSSVEFTEELNKNQQKHLARIVKETVETQARLDDQNTNPGYVLLTNKPNRELYNKAVTEIVTIKDVVSFLENKQAIFKGYKNSRGLIGACAAISWEPLDKTFELITYRSQKRWGTKRLLNQNSVQFMDGQCPGTFDNYDAMNHHTRISPNSPCPILYGIRGDDVNELVVASNLIQSEPVESWLLFETNQGTDEHLQQKNISYIHAFESVITQGSVTTNPCTIKGGHVFFTLQDSTDSIPCIAYEPTKEFRNIIRELRVGDLVEVYGGVREHPLTINLEKIKIKSLANFFVKTENPICPICSKHMKSKGTKYGYKCTRCRTTSNTPRIEQKDRKLQTGYYEVPVCARRHLSKPLKRMSISTFTMSVESSGNEHIQQ